VTTDRPDPQENDFPDRLAAPALRALAGAGISRLDQLTAVSEEAIKKLHGMGPKAIEQLRQALEARGLSFAHEPDENDRQQ
jgi:hypothetical protein